MSLINDHRVFLMAGYPGSGKSTLAQKMALFFGAKHISSDAVREKLFKSSRYDPVGDKVISTQRDWVYARLGEIVLEELLKHDKVIIDATNLEAPKREAILAVLLKKLAPSQICFVCVRTSPRVILSRLKKISDTSLSEKETLIEGWRRVYAIFEQRKKEGLLSWPKYKNICSISGKDMYAYLDQTN